MTRTVEIHYALSEAHREQLLDFYFTQWWTPTRSREQVEAALAASLPVVLADGDELVGFARILTDGTIYAYVGDVMVRPDRIGEGLGAALMDAVVAHPAVAPTAKWDLTCVPDMDGFYAKWGFAVPGSGSHVLRRTPAGPADGPTHPKESA